MSRRTLRVLVTTATVMLCGSVAAAQGVGGPVRQDSGPLRELSTNAGDGSGPVREGAGGVRDTNAGRLSGRSVRGAVSGDLVSGPVSEISAGPVTSGSRPSGRRTVTDLSAGAVTKDIDSPLREVVGAPVHGLGPLQERLRGIEPLPRDATIPVEAGADGGVEPQGEQADIDQAESGQIDTQPLQQVDHEADAVQAATGPRDLSEPASDAQPDYRDVEQWP